jgi:hypothetical protein
LLHVAFGDGAELTVTPDETYEAWNLTMDDGEMLVCMPNGEVAHFPPRPA